MNILITGVSGFIGTELARTLAKTNEVYGFIRHTSDRNQKRLGQLEDVHLISGDICSYHSVRSAIRQVQPEAVCHLAALTPVRNSFTDPMPYMPTNFEGTVNIVQSLKEEAPHCKLVMASTAEVYGWHDAHPINEKETLKPASPYAVSKAAADLFVQMAMRLDSLDSIILRPINSYGGIRPGYFIEYAIEQMMAKKPVYVGTPDSIRDYMFVEDHIQAYTMALKNGYDTGIYNVSPGNPVSNRQLVGTLQTMTGYQGRVHWGSYPPNYAMRPQGQDPSYLVLDSRKIRGQLKWCPNYTLEQGLKKTLDNWVLNN